MIEQVLKLQHGQHCILSDKELDDYGKAEVWFINGVYILFEIPLYGDIPVFYNKYSKEKISDLVYAVEHVFI